MVGHMKERSAHEQPIGTLRSSVAWALLGLVIERPSYGYELMQRFRRTYGETLALGSAKQHYNALETLRMHGLIEEVEGSRLDSTHTRHPRPHYEATQEGVRAYEEWLLTQMEEQHQQSRLFARQLSVLAPDAALEVLDEYEREWLAEADEIPPAEAERAGVAQRLAHEQEQMSLEARLTWIEYARNELKELIGHRPAEEEKR